MHTADFPKELPLQLVLPRISFSLCSPGWLNAEITGMYQGAWLPSTHLPTENVKVSHHVVESSKHTTVSAGIFPLLPLCFTTVPLMVMTLPDSSLHIYPIHFNVCFLARVTTVAFISAAPGEHNK